MGMTSFSKTSYSFLASSLSFSSGVGESLAVSMMKEFFPCLANSGTHPSGIDKFKEAFMAAVIPEVPEASWYKRGLLSHTSDPFFKCADSHNSYPVSTVHDGISFVFQ